MILDFKFEPTDSKIKSKKRAPRDLGALIKIIFSYIYYQIEEISAGKKLSRIYDVVCLLLKYLKNTS